jgi:hypothetical protein
VWLLWLATDFGRDWHGYWQQNDFREGKPVKAGSTCNASPGHDEGAVAMGLPQVIPSRARLHGIRQLQAGSPGRPAR